MHINNKKSSSIIVIFSHIFIWLLLLHIIYNLFGLTESFGLLFNPKIKFIDEALLVIPTLIGLFYWNTHFLIPKFLQGKTWWTYILALIISLIGFLVIGCFVFDIFWNKGYDLGAEDLLDFFDFSFVQHMIVIGISTSLGVSKIAIENARQKKQAQAKQREMELSYLKAQVSPHFLFNTLNTIYSLANDEDSPKTSEAIIKLSENMRYMVREASQNHVSLQEEIDFIQSYIDLQMMRLSDNVEIDFSIQGASQDQKIAPLLLIPFVENVFKHGVSYQKAMPIIIELILDDHSVTLKTKNSIKGNSSVPTGAGLDNTRKRLAYLYPDKHRLSIEQNEGNYEVELAILF